MSEPALIGPYTILDSLGKGGMGEVYLAKDPVFGRKVALKRIRPELQSNQTILNRFLREAHVASALSHPSIVPIFAIEQTPPNIYYTMPFIEGETLRQILKAAREEEKEGEVRHPIGRSIPALARIFLQVCEGVAYTHAKGVLHRDLKPENIIVGRFGETMIVDWGVADYLDTPEREAELRGAFGPADLTQPGKVAGTIAYMAPERLKGSSSSAQTDLYALGVILYQMLTLQLPFNRKTIAHYRKTAPVERLIDPIELAPYRDIPVTLAEVSKRCLAPNPADRFQSVEELIHAVKSYVEGRPEWLLVDTLDLSDKESWSFQENVLLAKNVALSVNLEEPEWASLSVTKQKFSDNIRCEARVELEKSSRGVAILLSVPDAQPLEENYSVWFTPTALHLLRGTAALLTVPLERSTNGALIAVERIDDLLRVFLDGKLQISFAIHIPLPGQKIGLLVRDPLASIGKIDIFEGSRNAQVNCLAVPNAFFSRRLYDDALQEYRRIGRSFPGRVEGREALFRAGLTLLEKAKAAKDDQLFAQALEEFGRLYKTPGAPLEYLGKAMVYEAIGDSLEEAKCLELALRKFPKHPLLPLLQEHILCRMHEASLTSRDAAYRIILLALRHLPTLFESKDGAHLIERLTANWEPLPFWLPPASSESRLSSIALQLAFCLGQGPILLEMGEESIKRGEGVLLANTISALLELGEDPTQLLDAGTSILPPLAHEALTAQNPAAYPREAHPPFLLRLLKPLVGSRSPFFEEIRSWTMSTATRTQADALEAWDALLSGSLAAGKQVFERYPLSALTDEHSPLHFAYGVWLHLTEGKEIAAAHFSGVLDAPHPWTTALPSHFLLSDKEPARLNHLFPWEEKELRRYLSYCDHLQMHRM